MYKLIVTSVIYKSAIVYHGTFGELYILMLELNRVGKYTFELIREQ